MRSNAVRSMQSQQNSWGTSQDVAIESFAYDSLTLPTISLEESQNITGNESNPTVVKLAISMIEAGLLKDEPNEKPLTEIVTNGLSVWMQSIWGTNTYLDMSVDLRSNVLDIFGLSVEDGYDQCHTELKRAVIADCGVDPTTEHMVLLFSSTGRKDCLLGKGVEYFESQKEGLGFEAVKMIEHCGMNFGVLGANWAKSIVSMAHWGGGESENDWAEMYEEDIGEFNGITVEEFYSDCYPEQWFKSKSLSIKSLLSLQKSECPKTAKLSKLILQLRRSNEAHHGFDMRNMSQEFNWVESLDANVFMGWKDFDGVYRLGDDYSNDYMNSGDCDETPGIGIELIPVNDPQWFAKIGKVWAEKAAVLHAMDELISLLSE